jgi:hypothetical protein
MHFITNSETCRKGRTRSLESEEAEAENDKTNIVTVLAFDDE